MLLFEFEFPEETLLLAAAGGPFADFSVVINCAVIALPEPAFAVGTEVEPELEIFAGPPEEAVA
jgi:hypothetical protein